MVSSFVDDCEKFLGALQTQATSSSTQRNAEKLAFSLISARKMGTPLDEAYFFVLLRKNLSTLTTYKFSAQLVYVAITEFNFFSPAWLDSKVRESYALLLRESMSLRSDWVERIFDTLAFALQGKEGDEQELFAQLVQNDPLLGQMGLKTHEAVGLTFDHLHLLIQDLVAQNPLFVRYLAQALPKAFPKIFTVSLWNAYVRNLIRITTYCPSLKVEFLSLVLEKLMELDQSINLDEFGEEDDNQPFQFEGLKPESNPFACIIPTDNSEQKLYAESMDELMVHLFSYLDNLLTNAKDVRTEFEQIFRVCEAKILPATNLHFVQFVLFYCSKFEDCAEHMLNELMKRFKEPSTFQSIRYNCVGFIHGFLQRAKFLQRPEIFHSAMRFFSEWAHSYLENVLRKPQEDLKALHIQVHSLFYMTCAGLFQTINYRTDVLSPEFIASLGLEKLIRSALNPFKVCPIEIVDEFCNHYEDMLGVSFESLLHQNERLALVDGHVDVFAPFDPYLLSESVKFITPLYFNWNDNSTHPSHLSEGERAPEEEEMFDSMSLESGKFYFSFGAEKNNNTPVRFSFQ